MCHSNFCLITRVILSQTFTYIFKNLVDLFWWHFRNALHFVFPRFPLTFKKMGVFFSAYIYIYSDHWVTIYSVWSLCAVLGWVSRSFAYISRLITRSFLSILLQVMPPRRLPGSPTVKEKGWSPSSPRFLLLCTPSFPPALTNPTLLPQPHLTPATPAILHL